MVHFVGAGSGAADLITVRGAKLLEKADVIIYAGSLVNPELLSYAKKECRIYNSAEMTLEEIVKVIEEASSKGQEIVRLHTGEPSIYGAVREQMDELDGLGIEYDSCPGVSACFGAAASLNLEYTLPGVSQTLIITRMEGRTPGMPLEKIEDLAGHQASMAIYLSTGMLRELSEKLIRGGYGPETPAALVYKATWQEEKVFICTLETLAKTASENGITKTAVVLVGEAVTHRNYEKSKLYSADFSTEYRPATKKLNYYDTMQLAERATAHIPARARYYAEQMGVSYAGITIRKQKTRWGSCSSKGRLNFNCLLMLTPPEIIDYVVVHELCHLKQMNHSKLFWDEVEKVLPDYKSRRKWLKDHGNEIMDCAF